MNQITIQPDTDLSSPWTAGFIDVGDSWEKFAATNNMKITGLLSPFGIKCTLYGSVPNFGGLEIIIQKKLENVTGILPQAMPYSAIINLKGVAKYARMGDRITVKRNGIFNRMVGLFSGLKLVQSSKKVLIYSNQSKLEMSIKTEDLETLKDLNWLKMSDQTFSLNSLSIPTEEKAISVWFEALDRVLAKNRC